MAWDEWEQLKSEAAGQRSTGMQLNRVPDESPGGAPPGGDLKADQQDLAAVGDSAFRLFDNLGKYGRDAWSVSQSAARDLSTQGFALGGALDHVQERWEKQLKTLLDACAHISNRMDFTQNAHAGDEHYVYGIVSSIATLDEGFTERTQR
ncbi:hypothetical protein GCM10010497_46260 [Streptomyces cinereoruber]|uniref:WXG100 family type VII secretion target n=1 Tax=Streptomyces cinereoruber TaxID=67260 RepID=A0AAV4KN33_9ACTN|nr:MULTISPECIES: hypothetical protein [Streptomyces]AVH96990.1 hypothetical protein C5L38_19555 [Streptomyces sp. WAC00288]KYG55599.1 hypothetical protein AWI43_15210 [Streptomyces sp. WAC04657]MBB4160095.1 hypothetical protein [Streptomyces cinereoruber]MBY8818295.1 hypothetical protein [Streptomyces cinereoruber]NIH61033.1 hypothetical protein [Streptomyces cinereoruber]